jgi:hypothetical protein
MVPAMKSWAVFAASSEMPLDERRWEAPVGTAVTGLLFVAMTVPSWKISNRMCVGQISGSLTHANGSFVSDEAYHSLKKTYRHRCAGHLIILTRARGRVPGPLERGC